MNLSIKYIGLFLILTLFGCKKSIREFEIVYREQNGKLKIYADSTFSIKSKKTKYSGNWMGKINQGDTISIISTMEGYNILTLTPTQSFRINERVLIPIKKNITPKEKKNPTIKKQIIEIPYYGKIDLSNKKSVKRKDFKGGDCGGSITRFKLDEKFITIDTTKCGDHGNTYTSYIIDSLSSIELVYKEELNYIDIGEIRKQLLIDFKDSIVVSRQKIDTIYSNKINKSKPFKTEPLSDVLTSYEHWNMQYDEIWTYNNIEE